MISSNIDFQRKLIKDQLISYLKSSGIFSSKLYDSIKYSLVSDGKLLRPLLTLDFCNMCSGSVQNALPFACCVEMIHTYSLVHDDLPCMDNDLYRRGKLSNHVVYGENFAVLCGDALFSLAAEVLTSKTVVSTIGEKQALKALNILFSCCGISGMVDGQAMDIFYKEEKNSLTTMDEKIKYTELVYLKKTGKLFGAACSLGALAANVNDVDLSISQKIGESVGVAYQIMDDLKDKADDALDLFLDDDVESLFKNRAKNLLSKAQKTLGERFKLSKDTSYVSSFIKKLEIVIEKL